jgi:hypothetical protein
MGKFLLLAHLQKATDAKNPEDLPIKNGFIHFDEPRECSNTLPRHRTAPSLQGTKIQQDLCSMHDADAEVDETPAATVFDDASTLASDGKSGSWDDNEFYAAGREFFGDHMSSEASEDALGQEAFVLIPDVEGRCESNVTPGEMPTMTPPTFQSEHDDTESPEPPSTWLVDGRRLKGRDTRLSSVLRPLVAGGPTSAELVVTIFPQPASEKRGGACFKAANGVGRIQLKCNNPTDMELAVCVTVGNTATRSQKHNFSNNPLMTFDGDWDFKASINPNVDRPTVAVSLELRKVEERPDPTMFEGAFSPVFNVNPSFVDPAIIAFVSAKFPAVADQLKLDQLKAHACDHDEAVQQSALFTPSSPRSLGTPEVTPRAPTTPQASDWPCELPPPSPFFSLCGSFLFNVTIRRADGVGFGLDVARDEQNHELIVQSVIPNGAAEAWNRQCFAGPFSSKAIVPTDRIVGINGRCDCEGMLEECRGRQLLKIFVVRGDLPHTEIPSGWCGVPNPSPTIQFVPVPIFFPVPCAKHDMVDCHGGYLAINPDHSGTGTVFGSFGCDEASTSGMLRASAPEFIPPGPGQDFEEILSELAEGVAAIP